MTDDKPWLSLPDEEPPERGLGELMAAARAKAEIMARPPWWKRVLDLMKRPPVLALATVVVLLGGVIVVGHHRDEVEDARPVVQPQPAFEAGSAVEVVPATPPAEKADEHAPPPPPPPPPKPAHHRAPFTKQPPATAHAVKQKVARGTTGGATEAVDHKAALDTADEALELAPEAPQVETGAAAPKKSTAKRPAALDDAVARCRAAAANNDCAGARACAKDVEARDPAIYKAKLATDPTLRPCL
jgi:hypothetical protein